VLLDACVPKRLARELPGLEVVHTSELGWSELDDGPLLDSIAGRFEVFVTVDRNIPNQQQLERRPFAVVLLRAVTNRLTDLARLIPKLRATLKRIEPGRLYELVD